MYNMPEIETLWLEFEEQKTSEAKFVKKLDKFDAVLQSQIYAKQHNMPELFDEFRINAQNIYDEMINLKR